MNFRLESSLTSTSMIHLKFHYRYGVWILWKGGLRPTHGSRDCSRLAFTVVTIFHCPSHPKKAIPCAAPVCRTISHPLSCLHPAPFYMKSCAKQAAPHSHPTTFLTAWPLSDSLSCSPPHHDRLRRGFHARRDALESCRGP
jgi:hypothetical protein